MYNFIIGLNKIGHILKLGNIILKTRKVIKYLTGEGSNEINFGRY